MIAPAPPTTTRFVVPRTVVALVLLTASVALMYFVFVRLVPPASRSIALRTIVVGIISNVSCALIGTYLVLRRMSLLGDAISHAVLPGIALAVLLSGSVQGWPILVGALIVGVLTALAAQGLHGFGGVSEDASLGVVYTSLFALGVILLQIWAPKSHLDADCVLYGAIETAGLAPPLRWLGLDWPPAAIRLLIVLGLVIAFITVCWKELLLVSFDAALARAMGLPALLIHLALMGIVAVVTVASFESVGSILVVPMLVAPAATARLLTDRLSLTLALAALAATTAAIFGYLAAHAWNTSVAGMMATLAGVQLALAVLFSPDYGLVSKWLRNLSMAVKISAEDILAQLYRAEERGVAALPAEHPGGWLVGQLARFHVWRKGWAQRKHGVNQLTSAGREQALGIVRAHRLWETYLATHFELRRDHLHEPAERMEHFLNSELQQQLASELAGQALDPHGAPIPPPSHDQTR